MPANRRGRQCFDAVVLEVLGRKSDAGGSVEQPPAQIRDGLLISTDPKDWEATAAVSTLVCLMQEALLAFGLGGVCMLADHDDNIGASELASCVRRCRAVIIVLSHGGLQPRAQLPVMIATQLPVMMGAMVSVSSSCSLTSAVSQVLCQPHARAGCEPRDEALRAVGRRRGSLGCLQRLHDRDADVAVNQPYSGRSTEREGCRRYRRSRCRCSASS